MRRGEVRWYRFSAPDKHRPVLIVTRSSAIPELEKIVVATITTRIRDLPSEVYLTPNEEGMLRECVVNFDNLFTIPKAHIEKRITTLSAERMLDVDNALKFALGIDRSIF